MVDYTVSIVGVGKEWRTKMVHGVSLVVSTQLEIRRGLLAAWFAELSTIKTIGTHLRDSINS